MSLDFRPGHRIFVYQEMIDMRAGFGKLSHFVREGMGQSLEEGDFFLFLGKNRKRIKGLCFDGTGLVHISKRMKHGRFMSLLDLEEKEVNAEELHTLFHGGIVSRKKFGTEALTKKHKGINVSPYGASFERKQHRSP